MPDIREKMTQLIQAQPEDSSYDEIMRELAFERMIARGLKDSSQGKVFSNEQMKKRIKSTPTVRL